MHTHSKSDIDRPIVQFHSFIVLESIKEILTKLSFIVIENVLSSRVEPKYVNKNEKRNEKQHFIN